MDGTTEPLIAIIGHPIAGNPSQFALERALSAMNLDWRVLSFDVPPNDMAAALEGAEVLGMRGILIDQPLTHSASEWFQKREPQAGSSDCFSRSDEGALMGHHLVREWLASQAVSFCAAHPPVEEDVGDGSANVADTSSTAELSETTDAVSQNNDSKGPVPTEPHRSDASDGTTDAPPPNALWLGQRIESLMGFTQFDVIDGSVLLDPDELAARSLIVIGEGIDQTLELDSEDWPTCQESCLVIDMTEGHPELAVIGQRGYLTIDAQQRQAGILALALARWTRQPPPLEVIHEAIEEYLAV